MSAGAEQYVATADAHLEGAARKLRANTGEFKPRLLRAEAAALLARLEALEQRVEAAERAYELASTDCRNLTSKVIPNLRARLSEQETLLAERNRQNAAAFADRDALLADQRRLLYLASTASMNWGHRDRAGYTLDPLQFESARDVIHPDDFRRAIDAAMAGPCQTCHGSELVTIRGMCGGVEMDCDDQPCPDCEDIRGEAMAAKSDDWLTREARQIGLHSPACASVRFGQNECDCGAKP